MGDGGGQAFCCIDENIVVCSPPIPFWHGIPGGLRLGKMVEIRGVLPYGAESFHFDFTDGIDGGGHMANRILHVSVRPPERVVVRNSANKGTWQNEERGGDFPFVPGKQFIVLILVESSGYRVAVNGRHQWEFTHRRPVECANVFHIDGSVRIEEVRIFEREPPVPCIPVVPRPQSVTVDNPVIPSVTRLPAPLEAGGFIEIKGFVPHKAEVFQINLVCNALDDLHQPDRPLHLSIRFKDSVVVRNTMRNGNWEKEERGGTFPFGHGRPFLIRILADKQCYRISVDGRHFCEFRHRISMFLATKLLVDGNVIIDRLILSPFRTQYDKSNLTTRVGGEMHQPVINPVIPFRYNIPEGLEDGIMVYVSGHPAINAQRFTVNLVCCVDRNKSPYDHDIALHFDARLYNRTVVRNTKLGGHWLSEETLSPYFPFAPNLPFDMLVRVDRDKYMIAVNGQHFAYYQHRIKDLSRINQIHIDGNVVVSRLRLKIF